MIAESPLALTYILQDDVFFLRDDRQAAALAATANTESIAHEPVAAYQAPEPVADAPALQNIPTSMPQTVENAPETIVKIPSMAQPVQPVSAASNSNPSTTPAPATDFKYQGGFAQKFLIIVHYAGQDGMDQPHFAALESTITRKGMSMTDVAIFNIANYPGTDLKAIARFFKPMRMLLLGNDAFPVGLVPQPFNQLTMLGKCHLLYSDSFKDMMGNKEKIKTFWEQMKLL